MPIKQFEILTDGGDRAYYSPSQDKIHLPTPESFQNEYAFNATALHEEAHAFGHPTRLNRPHFSVHTSMLMKNW